MSISLKLGSILFCIFIIIFLIALLKKDKVNIKYALIWIILFGLLFICCVIPGFLNKLTVLLGFKTASNMVFSLIIGVLVIINISLTMIDSKQDKKILLLIQEVSLLKNNKKEK